MQVRHTGAGLCARHFWFRAGLGCALALLAVVGLFAAASLCRARAQAPYPQAVARAQPAAAASQQPPASAVDERRQQIDDDCAQLLKLATVLKAEVDKTSKDELSMSVVRRATQVERLARKVKDEMKPAVVRDH